MSLFACEERLNEFSFVELSFNVLFKLLFSLFRNVFDANQLKCFNVSLKSSKVAFQNFSIQKCFIEELLIWVWNSAKTILHQCNIFDNLICSKGLFSFLGVSEHWNRQLVKQSQWRSLKWGEIVLRSSFESLKNPNDVILDSSRDVICGRRIKCKSFLYVV